MKTDPDIRDEQQAAHKGGTGVNSALGAIVQLVIGILLGTVMLVTLAPLI